ncbi:MAG: hypothetical protein EPGJADBJ_04235 [Saprospiraceae bacterium]|nr:hypothetical protein [Saprospiraceae bacterium]
MDDKHTFTLVLFFLLTVGIVAVFLYAYLSSLPSSSAKGGLTNPKKKRFLLFFILMEAVIILFTLTLPRSPYFFFANSTPSKVVFVAARQFSFAMSYQTIAPDTQAPAKAIELPRGKPVEFRVTSFDVNHGFAIYDMSGNLIAQTQAMPGYINRLRWVFDSPGEYNILCLEYCGMAHAFMRTSFNVK